MIQHIIGIHNSYQSYIIKIQTFSKHLGSNQYINFPIFETVNYFFKTEFSSCRILVHSSNFVTWEKFNQFLLAPYFGPGLLPHAQKLWIDELAVGTKRIGPLEPNE